MADVKEVLCPECGKRRQWKDVDFTYRRAGGWLTRLLWDRTCGGLIREEPVGEPSGTGTAGSL